MTLVLEASELDAGYDRNVRVVRRADIEVRAGEVVALLGANGAGKTTTLRTLAGEMPALGGEVRFLGRVVDSPFFQRARDGLGFVTEERAVLMSLTTRENFKIGRCDLEMALGLFPELADHLDRKVGLLSGGQQQMLALGIVLSRCPKVILADELSLGLAPLVVERLLQALRDAADAGVGVLLVEQHIHKAVALADRVYVMRRGEILISGSSAEIGSRIEEIQRAYLSLNAPES